MEAEAEVRHPLVSVSGDAAVAQTDAANVRPLTATPTRAAGDPLAGTTAQQEQRERAGERQREQQRQQDRRSRQIRPRRRR